MKRSRTQESTQTVASYGSKRSRARSIPRNPRSQLSFKRATNSTGFPQRLTIKHRYSEVVGLTGTTGALSTYFFRCNGMFDPNQTGTGHQPYYFDQLTAVYNHFCVVRSKITVKFNNQSAAGIGGTVGIVINDDGTFSGSNGSTANEMPSAVHTLIPGVQWSNRTLTKTWSARDTFGGSLLANDNLQGTAAADPTEQSTFMLYAFSQDGTNTLAVFADVLIEYEAVWSELKDISAS